MSEISQKFFAAACQLDAEARQLDARRQRPPATEPEVEAHQQLTTNNRFMAAFANQDPATLVSRQSGGPVESHPVTRTPAQSTEARFREAFGRRPEPPPAAAQEPQLEPAPVAAADDRKRQQALPQAAADLFDNLQQRLTAAPATPEPSSPDVAMRRALQGLTGADRAQIEQQIQAEHFHPGYFEQRGFSESFRQILSADALAQRLQDARRLDPSITPDVLVSRMIQAGQE